MRFGSPDGGGCIGQWLSTEEGGPGWAWILMRPDWTPPHGVGLISYGPPAGPNVYMVYHSWDRLELHISQGGTYHVSVTFGQEPEQCAGPITVVIPPEIGTPLHWTDRLKQAWKRIWPAGA